jgi:hypothetical protein
MSLTSLEDRIAVALEADETGQVQQLLKAIYAWTEDAKKRYD